MRGPTHALGGVAALAGYTLLTGEPMPAWAYGLAGLSALVPDADNHGGTILNRPHLTPIKVMTFPLWYKADHRGRTHSLVGTAMFAAILLFWVWLAGLAADWSGSVNPLTLDVVLIAGVLGYLSHLFLDLWNKKNQQILWPLPIAIQAPVFSFSASGFVDWALHLVLIGFVGWFMIDRAGEIAAATGSDPFFAELPGFLAAVFGSVVGAAGDFLGSLAGGPDKA